MSPSFNSGVGFVLIISLAIDQIFCFAPSIKPPIEPVVSRTKHTSMRGLVSLAAAVFARHECELAATNAIEATKFRGIRIILEPRRSGDGSRSPAPRQSGAATAGAMRAMFVEITE